ncbi:hypothetical protein [Agrobacterium vitis]|uniref:hypothetical protein n=1 Tax=Agrobacterium vitis TaxID=373 RepID=UPI0020364A8B|nr:hypothetical protein [Agrobacterium vitis]
MLLAAKGKWKMLPLNDPRWKELRHAYGDATDLPQLLQALDSSTETMTDKTELWFSLWSRLCHQGDVYTASYVAVPHIIRIAGQAKGPINSSFFQLPTAIEIARKTGLAPEIPKVYAEDYHHAISQLVEIVYLHLKEDWDQETLLAATAAQAVAKGHVAVANALLNLTDDLIAEINSGEFE